MKDNNKNIPSIEGGIKHVMQDAVKRVQQMTDLMMVPEGLREEFYGMMIGEFMNGMSCAFQIRKIVADHPDAKKLDDGECFELIRQLADNTGYKTVLSAESEAELSERIQEVRKRLTGVRKELVESLPPEIREVALKMLAKILQEDGVDPNDVDLRHVGIDPSRN